MIIEEKLEIWNEIGKKIYQEMNEIYSRKMIILSLFLDILKSELDIIFQNIHINKQ